MTFPHVHHWTSVAMMTTRAFPQDGAVMGALTARTNLTNMAVVGFLQNT